MSNLTGGAQDPCYAGCGWCTPGEGESGGARLAMSRAAASDRAGGATGSGGNPGGGAN